MSTFRARAGESDRREGWTSDFDWLMAKGDSPVSECRRPLSYRRHAGPRRIRDGPLISASVGQRHPLN